MTKLKSESLSKKKIRITKNGKVMYVHQMGRHLRINKSKSQKRRLKGPGIMGKTMSKKIIRTLPYA